jgi:hypothetical protein
MPRNTRRPYTSSSRSMTSLLRDTLALASERYAAVVALRQDCVPARPEAVAIFDFLEHYWPRLNINNIGSNLIPSTNNTVERVIGRFDQQYQNFCGFESIADAQRYLAVFKRFTASPLLARCPAQRPRPVPLQLAGTDVSQLPMTTLCAGLSICLAGPDSGERTCPQHVTVSFANL